MLLKRILSLTNGYLFKHNEMSINPEVTSLIKIIDGNIHEFNLNDERIKKDLERMKSLCISCDDINPSTICLDHKNHIGIFSFNHKRFYRIGNFMKIKFDETYILTKNIFCFTMSSFIYNFMMERFILFFSISGFGNIILHIMHRNEQHVIIIGDIYYHTRNFANSILCSHTFGRVNMNFICSKNKKYIRFQILFYTKKHYASNKMIIPDIHFNKNHHSKIKSAIATKCQYNINVEENSDIVKNMRTILVSFDPLNFIYPSKMKLDPFVKEFYDIDFL